MHACNSICSAQELSEHAIYMRLKRLCMPTGAGKLSVSKDISDQWATGDRDQLTLALVQALKVHGFSNTSATRKLVRAGSFVIKKFLTIDRSMLTLKSSLSWDRRSSQSRWCASASGLAKKWKKLREVGSVKSAWTKIWDTASSLSYFHILTAYWIGIIIVDVDSLIF